MSEDERARIFLITNIYFKNRTQIGLPCTQWDITYRLKTYYFVPCTIEKYFLIAFHLHGHNH